MLKIKEKIIALLLLLIISFFLSITTGFLIRNSASNKFETLRKKNLKKTIEKLIETKCIYVETILEEVNTKNFQKPSNNDFIPFITKALLNKEIDFGILVSPNEDIFCKISSEKKIKTKKEILKKIIIEKIKFANGKTMRTTARINDNIYIIISKSISFRKKDRVDDYQLIFGINTDYIVNLPEIILPSRFELNENKLSLNYKKLKLKNNESSLYLKIVHYEDILKPMKFYFLIFIIINTLLFVIFFSSIYLILARLHKKKLKEKISKKTQELKINHIELMNTVRKNSELKISLELHEDLSQPIMILTASYELFKMKSNDDDFSKNQKVYLKRMDEAILNIRKLVKKYGESE